MTARALMFQGTGSDVGKSVIVAGLCRALRLRGMRVVPFKPQNMSNNAAVTADGGEIGRAQALQARAAGIAASVHMNPVLLKPEGDRGSQVVIHGRVSGAIASRDWSSRRDRFMTPILDSFGQLASSHEMILVEGAGSPAETNLRAGDVANMGFARAAGVPVVLIGDIDRGGVIASLIGTHAVLDDADRAHIRAFMVNKFRGDPALFADGLRTVAEMTGWHSMGIVPWLAAVSGLPAEDAVPLERGAISAAHGLKIAVPMLSRIANFDDLDPLRAEPGVSIVFVPPGTPLPLDADAVILPGTKSTLADLAMLRAQGWDTDILALARAGRRVLGLCGGFQLLGRTIRDGHGLDGAPGEAAGLGLLDVTTEMAGEKTVREAAGVSPAYGAPVRGYEIHLGVTEGPDCRRPLTMLDGQGDGARSPNGLVEGSYLHGLFHADGFRRAWLASFGDGVASTLAFEAQVDAALDSLAADLEKHLDMDGLVNLSEPVGWTPRR